MVTLTKTISSAFDTVKRRIIKVLRFGKDDVQTAYEALPYGTDSSPIKNMIAVFSETDNKGKTVIIGYINKNQLAQSGEHRIYATDDSGTLKFYIWLKNTGVCEIGGNADNAVRFSPLETATDKLATDIQAELAKIQAAIAGVGGTYVPGTISIDISGAKINEVKTL